MKAVSKARWKRTTIAALALAASVIAAASVVDSVGAAGNPPVNVSPPTITGNKFQAGAELQAKLGTWTGENPITFAQRWQRCDATGTGCVDIPGETDSTYLLSTADASRTVRVVVTAVNASATVEQPSAVTRVIQAGPSTLPANTTPPSISGTPREGLALTAVEGTWTGLAPITYDYVWYRCDPTGAACVAITGATKQTYTATSDDVSKTLRVKITAKNTSGKAAALSGQTAAVGSAQPASLIKLPNGQISIAVSDVKLPDQLIITKFSYSPQPLHNRSPFTIKVTVHDANDYVVRDALVYCVALPYNRVSMLPERKTAQDGTISFTVTPLKQFPLQDGARLEFFVRARNPVDQLIAGVSARRLVETVIRPS